MARGKKSPDIEAIIKEAVHAGIQAGRLQGQKIAGDAYKMTEKRLWAYSVLREKIADSYAQLDEYNTRGVPEKSNSVVRFSRSGVRLAPDEVLEMLVLDLRAKIASDQHEVDTIAGALKTIENDPYYEVIAGRFLAMPSKTDDEIAAEVHCDPSTVRRNRGRLMRRLAVWLYGVEAL